MRRMAMPIGSERTPRAPGRAIAVGTLLVALMGSCAPAVSTGRTHVARVERMQTGDGEYDRLFRVVYEMQLAINESEHEKVDTIARLAQSLGLPEGADLGRCANAVRTWSNELQRLNLSLSFEIDPGRPIGGATVTAAMVSSAPSASPPPTSALRGVPDAFPEPQGTAEREVSIETRVAGGVMPAEAEPRARAVRTAIRAALALKRRMDAISSYAPIVRAVAQQLATTLHQRAPARASQLEPEFHDAIDFLEGAGGRAQAQAQAAFQIAVRLQASATASGEQ